MNQHHHTHGQAAEAGPAPLPVRFELIDPTAHRVCVAGCFNRWQPDGNPLKATGKGHWRSEIALSPGTYEYRFVVDGRWMADPHAHETVANPFGGRNSILKVAGAPAAVNEAGANSGPTDKANPPKTKRL